MVIGGSGLQNDACAKLCQRKLLCDRLFIGIVGALFTGGTVVAVFAVAAILVAASAGLCRSVALACGMSLGVMLLLLLSVWLLVLLTVMLLVLLTVMLLLLLSVLILGSRIVIFRGLLILLVLRGSSTVRMAILLASMMMSAVSMLSAGGLAIGCVCTAIYRFIILIVHVLYQDPFCVDLRDVRCRSEQTASGGEGGQQKADVRIRAKLTLCVGDAVAKG